MLFFTVLVYRPFTVVVEIGPEGHRGRPRGVSDRMVRVKEGERLYARTKVRVTIGAEKGQVVGIRRHTNVLFGV